MMTLSTDVARIARATLVALAALMLTVPAATAATRTMTGLFLITNPSAGVDTGPGVFGRKVGGVGPIVFGPTAGAKTLSVAGATTGTFVGRQITVPANVLNHSGMLIRKFPAFANVANLTKSWMEVQQPVTFGENGGALGYCPGPGCTAAGAGSAISFCPPLAHNPAAPAPGTVGAPIGNWDCPSWPAGAGGGDRFIRMGISNLSGRPNFGGTLSMLRNFVQNTWRIPVQPSTQSASDAQATRSFMLLSGIGWSPGRPNFEFLSGIGNNGPRVFARLDASGAVASTFGCTNMIGTPGGTFMGGGTVRPNVGNNCGTNPELDIPGQAWGFALTTGTLSGSDPYPFGLVVTTVAGSPFNPNFGTQPQAQGFFFSRMGTDRVTGTGSAASRNLVLLGGAIAVDPDSGNAFFRIMDIHMTMTTPEPASGLGLAAGVMLVGFAARRRRAQAGRS